MKKLLFLTLAFSYSFLILNSQGIDNARELYADFLNSDWDVVFSDPATGFWEEKWFLDGQRATIRNMSDGMLYSAGLIAYDNASHAVLWTKKSFSGDVKIEYDYTRMDDINSFVNIVYIQATGIGEGPYAKDISKWSDLRIIPKMSTYFMNMNLLHISYAAFNNTDDKNKPDYVRARRYPATHGANFTTETVVQGTFENTGFFKPGIKYHITIIKTDNKLFMNVEGEDESKLFSWDTSAFDPVDEGRIGFRHMWTRCSKYANIEISEIK